jgi:hypothetical protein
MPGRILRRGSFAIAADGRRVLITTPLADSTSLPITVVLDWRAVLKSTAR